MVGLFEVLRFHIFNESKRNSYVHLVVVFGFKFDDQHVGEVVFGCIFGLNVITLGHNWIFWCFRKDGLLYVFGWKFQKIICLVNGCWEVSFKKCNFLWNGLTRCLLVSFLPRRGFYLVNSCWKVCQKVYFLVKWNLSFFFNNVPFLKLDFCIECFYAVFSCIG